MALFLSGVQLIAAEEGKKYKAYKDSRGIWTIGRGYNLESHGYSKEEASKQEWNDERIETEFAASIMRCVNALNKNWPGWVNLSEVRQAVCLSSVFQLGSDGAAKFVATIDALEDHDFDRAAGQIMLSKWAKQTPARVRRNADMLQHDEWPKQVNGSAFAVTEGCILETVEDIVAAMVNPESVVVNAESTVQTAKQDSTPDEPGTRVLPPLRYGDGQIEVPRTGDNLRVVDTSHSDVKGDTAKGDGDTLTLRIPNLFGVRISKKLTTTIIGALLVVFNHPLGLGLTPVEIDAIKTMVVSYVLGQAGVDFGGPVVGPIIAALKKRFNV